MKIIHLSWLKRSEENLGGVEKFAHYLNRALTEAGHECQIVAWSDYPNRSKVGNIGNVDAALLLGSWVESEYDFDVAVTDGYWGAGITRHPVAAVIHGTWAQFHVNMMNPSPWLNAEVRAQHDAFNAINVFPVACSRAAARELEQHHRRQAAATILHGVDLKAFYPRKVGGFTPDHIPVVLHAATNEKKGSGLMPGITRELGPEYFVSYLQAKAGEEPQAFQRGDLFLHPSKHEGCSFALIEAIATGLPIATTDVGMFEDIPDFSVGRVLPISTTVAQWAAVVREIWGDGRTPYKKYAEEARRTAKDIADFERFKAEWVMFLEGLA